MVRAFGKEQKEILTQGNGNMERQMDMESTLGSMAIDMKESSKKA